ncbi:hypothetical protein OGY14_02050 [Citrobacter sp. Cpo073]|uniref:hypothetical protein n=1 Tax=Citrobacter TaxID=544 RepID=UPI001F09A67A|nr:MULTISPECIES: hypothetical protein [Citrobacter]MCH2697896.1 hypothetical protein [Citrobacter portucalensis]MDM2860982.1 hypothetical protein [Citrobacter sp. Cpo073]
MSESDTPVAEHQTKKIESNVKIVIVKSCQCYFRIEKLQLIFIDEADASAFEDAMSKLSNLVNTHHIAKKKYSNAIEKYGVQLKDTANKDRLPELEKEISKAEGELQTATKNLQQELGEFREESGYKPIIELIPIEDVKKKAFGRFYSYIKEEDYKKFEEKFTVISVDDFSGDKIFTKDKDNNIIGIDIKSLSEKLKAARVKIKQMMDRTMIVSANIKYEDTLTEWASVWNDKTYNKTGEYIDVSAGAQFMRLTANASTFNSWNPDTGQAQIKSEAQAELTVFSGKVTSTIYVPDRTGWPLKFMINDKDEANIGVLRAKIDGELTGYVGASAKVEANLQFVTHNNKQLLMGNRTKSSTFAERKEGVKVKGNKGKAKKGLEVKAEAFGGAKVGASLGGTLQWLKPFTSLVAEIPAMLRKLGLDPELMLDSATMAKSIQLRQENDKKKDDHLGTFQNFGSLKVGGEVQLGAGASGEFRVRFVKGRFRFHIHGSLCLGPGAKGLLEGEINPELFMEFAVWVIYQLYGMDYKHWVIIEEEAFKALGYILLMDQEKKYQEYYDKAKAEFDNVLEDFTDFIKSTFADIMMARDQSAKRNKFASEINSNPGNVYLYSPEAKGAALYILTLDGAYDRIDINNQGDGFIPDTNHERKKAVLFILSSIQTKREWKKVLTRITAMGTVYPGNEDAIVKMAQKNIRIFLQTGIDSDDDLDDIIDKLELRDFDELVSRLKEKPTYGYSFSPNCSKQYKLHCDDNPFYNSLCHFVPVEPQYQQKWESND